MEAERVSGTAVPDIRSKHVRNQSFEEAKRTNTPHSRVSHPRTTNFPKENRFNQLPNTIIILVLQPGSSFDRPRDAICISWGILARVVYRVKESALCPTTVWWIRPPYLYPPETGWSSYTYGH